MEIHKVGAHIGAEIRGVDPVSMDDASFEKLRQTLLDHHVIFFRGTSLDDEAHLALAARFGPPGIFPMQQLFGDPEPRITAIVDGPSSPPVADGWHTDVTWTAEPPVYAVLRSIEIPEAGGDTLWASMAAAYEALSATMRGMLDPLKVRHDNEGFVKTVTRKLGKERAREMRFAERMFEAFPPVEHPLIRTHPETGRKAIFWGGDFMKHIVDVTEAESRALLSFLERHIESPHFHCRWRWRPGDLAIWDERATIHRALGDHFPARREVRRITVGNDRPY